MSQGTKEEFFVRIQKSFINQEGEVGGGKRAQFMRHTSVFKRPNFGGKLGKESRASADTNDALPL